MVINFKISNPTPKYNPSGWKKRMIIASLAGLDMLIAFYMALFQYRLIDSIWEPIFGEQSAIVLGSNFSTEFQQYFGLSDALIGGLAYLLEIILLMSGSSSRWSKQPWLVVLSGVNIAAIAGTGLTLLFLQATVIKAWCLLCITTTVISLTILVLALQEVLTTIRYLKFSWSKSNSFITFINIFTGRYATYSNVAD